MEDIGDIENNKNIENKQNITKFIVVINQTWGEFGIELLKFVIMLIFVFIIGFSATYAYCYYFN